MSKGTTASGSNGRHRTRAHSHAHPHHKSRTRRRGRKRRAVVKGIVMGAMIFGAQAKPKASPRMKDSAPPIPEVHVSIDSFAAVPPYLAYDDIIDEAARTHGVDPDLIHAV